MVREENMEGIPGNILKKYFQLLSKHFSCACFKDNVFQLELILSLSLSSYPDFSKPENIQHDCNGRF